MDKKKAIIADFAMLMVALLWGGSFVAAKIGLESFPPFMLMAIRFLIATVLILLFLFKKIGKLNKNDIKQGLIAGALNFVGFSLQTIGLMFTSAAKQGILTCTYVILVPFIVWVIYKQFPGVKLILCALTAFIGIFLISYKDLIQLSFNFGDFLTLISSIFYALLIIYVDHALKTMPPIRLSFLQCIFTSVPLLILSTIFEKVPHNLSMASWYSVLYLAIFATFLATIIWTCSQKYIAPSRTSIIMSTESLFAVVLAVLILNERLALIQNLGIIIMFLSILFVEIGPRRKPRLERE